MLSYTQYFCRLSHSKALGTRLTLQFLLGTRLTLQSLLGTRLTLQYLLGTRLTLHSLLLPFILQYFTQESERQIYHHSVA